MPDRETIPPNSGDKPGQRAEAEAVDRGTTRITQGHPTYAEPGADKGGATGAPKPDGRTAQDAANGLPAGGADAGASQDDPGRGAD